MLARRHRKIWPAPSLRLLLSDPLECHLQATDKGWAVILILKWVIGVAGIEAERRIVQIVTFEIERQVFVDRILNFGVYLEIAIEIGVG